MRLTLLLLCLLVAGAPPAGAEPRPAAFRLPVDGRVLEHFDAPASRYLAGHRGVDLAAPAGSVVAAAGPGTVSFAEVVAGARWVTVDHGGGLTTTYGELGRIDVQVGRLVAAGQRLGVAGPTHGRPGVLHWGARRHGEYIDPLTLLDLPWVPTLVGPGGWDGTHVAAIPRYAAWDGRHRLGLVPGSQPATGPGWVLAPNPNHIITIAGLGTHSGELAVDATHLGYAPEDVTAFSYAGRDEDGRLRDYGPEDTWRGVEAAARRLREELRRRWAASPGQAVDLVGHSMGGVVAMYYLLALHDPADPTLPPVAHVATIASPLEGTDVAAALVNAQGDGWNRAIVEWIDARVDRHDASAPAVRDLVPGSPVVDAVTGGWAVATGDPYASPLATGTRVLTIGASRDPVVPEHRSDLPDAAHVVAPGGHDGVKRTEAVRTILHEFLADAPVPGEAGGVGSILSHPIGWAARLVLG